MTVPSLRCSVVPVRSGAPDAQLIVLGPSLGTTSALWDAVAPGLAADHRVLRFDLPGHGFSPAARESFTVDELAEAVLVLVDSIGGGSFHYAGDSLGGAIGLTLALRHPERVRSLATFCTPGRFGEPDGWHARAAQVRASGTPSVVGASANRWFAPGYLERDPGPGARALDLLMDVDDESYALCCEALAGWDIRATASGIATASVISAGEVDATLTSGETEALAAQIPGARFEIVAGAGHLPVMERPAESEAIIRSILPAGGSRDATHAAGMTVRRAVLGDAHVDAAVARTTPETADFQDFITRYAWGEVWTRSGLDRRSRSLLTLASLITGGHENEIAMHIRGGLTNGLSRAEISEALLHVAIYAGVPASNAAFAIAREVFAELDSHPTGTASTEAASTEAASTETASTRTGE